MCWMSNGTRQHKEDGTMQTTGIFRFGFKPTPEEREQRDRAIEAIERREYLGDNASFDAECARCGATRTLHSADGLRAFGYNHSFCKAQVQG